MNLRGIFYTLGFYLYACSFLLFTHCFENFIYSTAIMLKLEESLLRGIISILL
jgi:hypothetical protein